MILTWLIIFACYVWQAIYVAEFMAGLFIADLSLSRHPERLGRVERVERVERLDHHLDHDHQDHNHPRSLAASHSLHGQKEHEHEHQHPTLWTKVGYTALFLLGIFLLGEPDNTSMGILGTFPWAFLKSWIPSWWRNDGKYLFWLGPGAFMLVYALEFYPVLQKPLHWRYSQYLGDVSFGIYAMHIPLAIGPYFQVMIPLREKWMGNWPVVKYIPGFVLFSLMVLIAADYFERVDKMVIRFARWLQNKMFVA
jgi:hypothetical protein